MLTHRSKRKTTKKVQIFDTVEALRSKGSPEEHIAVKHYGIIQTIVAGVRILRIEKPLAAKSLDER